MRKITRPRRYSIRATEHDGEREICQVDSNPNAIIRALQLKKKYFLIHVVDTAEDAGGDCPF